MTKKTKAARPSSSSSSRKAGRRQDHAEQIAGQAGESPGLRRRINGRLRPIRR